MSLIVSASESLKRSNRRILVTGPRGTGKTTFSVSASSFAGDSIEGEKRECSDLLLIQGDNEGAMGAMDAGLIPGHVLDMTECDTWATYQARLVGGLKEMAEQFKDGRIKYVVLDLNWPAKLIDRSIDPNNQKDWKLVANEGLKLFRSLSMPGVTIIGNAQIKASASPGETQQSIDAANAKSIGGERTTFSIDLPKGIATIWQDNTSFIFNRQAKRKKNERGEIVRVFSTMTQSDGKSEAKNRASTVLSPVEPGSATMHSLLKRVYGENI